MAEKTYNITLTANHQSLTAEYLPLAAESVQYLTAKVVCETEDWTGREIKALFGQGCTVYEIPVTGGEITAKQQLNLTAGDWRVWLVGNSARDGEVIPRITTNVAHISVAPTGGTEGNPFPIIPPTVEEQLRADMGNLDDLTTEDKSSLVAAINEAAASGGSKDAVTYTPQTLTEEQKSQARTNIGAEKAGTAYTKPASGIPKSDLADDVQTSLNKADAAISYDSQTLTEAQQKQARANIGAGQPVFAVNVTEVVESGGYTADKTAAEIEAAYQAGRTIVCKMQARFVIGYIPVELPLVSRNQGRDFSFAGDQLVQGNWILATTVNISDSRVEVFNNMVEIYEKPGGGIPKSDLEQSVQTSLAKADTAISLGLTSATPGQIIKVKTVQDGKPTEWEAVDMPSGEEWEKIADIELRADTAWYVLANFAVWRKAKVIMRRPTYVSGLDKNVWCRVRGKNDTPIQGYSCGYLTSEYGYVYWEFSAEVSNNVISSTTLRSNNININSPIQSTQTLTPINLPPTDYVFTLIFTDTSMIQDGDKVTVIGVRR